MTVANSRTSVFEIFHSCAAAITDGRLIKKVSATDKEFHFQNWVQDRLSATCLNFDTPGRNTYPDFPLVHYAEGFEVKGLAYPGRDKNYDANSQLPTGFHNGRTIFYVFGRYPKQTASTGEYPVIDLVVVHGDFLNADHSYVHKNKSVKGFGSYGDIMIRDRKMYVVPTPYAIAGGLEHARTLIVPASYAADSRFTEVGTLTRTEVRDRVQGYEFDLDSNEISAKTTKNETAGVQHHFKAYRVKGDSGNHVTIP